MTGHLTLRRHQHSVRDYNTAVNVIRSEPINCVLGLHWTQLGQLSMRSHACTVTFLLPVALYLCKDAFPLSIYVLYVCVSVCVCCSDVTLVW